MNLLREKLLRLRTIATLDKHLDIAFFCIRFLKGYGVDLVVAMQAQALAAFGHRVRIYTLNTDQGFIQNVLGHTKIEVVKLSIRNLSFQVEGITCDVAIAHTDPFFSLILKMNDYVTKIAWDHGEPNPEFFPEEMLNRKAQIEARRSNQGKFHQVVAISEYIKNYMGLESAIIAYSGSDHLKQFHPPYQSLAGKTIHLMDMRGYKFEKALGNFLLCVSRLGENYRKYKGTENLQELSSLTGLPILLAGRSDREEDVTYFRNQGLICLDNLTSEELISIYLDCAAYVSLSEWEGYNLPLIEAISFGKMAFALDRGAHRETGAYVAENVQELAVLIKDKIVDYPQKHQHPQSHALTWKEHSLRLLELIGQTRIKHLATLLGDNSNKLLPALLSRTALPRIRNIQSKHPRKSPYFLNKEDIDLSILILSKDKIDLLKPCLESLQQTLSDITYEVLIGDTGSNYPSTEFYYKSLIHPIFYLGKYNFSWGNNVLSQQARGKFILMLNNDIEAIVPSVHEVLHLFAQGNIGAVGGKLLYPNFRIQHAGVYICHQAPYEYVPEHLHRFDKSSLAAVNRSQEVPAVTGACLFTPRELFLNAHGLDETYQEECQDVDYCFKLKAEYQLNSFYYAESTWIHKEGQTRTAKESSYDRSIFIERWKGLIDREFS